MLELVLRRPWTLCSPGRDEVFDFRATETRHLHRRELPPYQGRLFVEAKRCRPKFRHRSLPREPRVEFLPESRRPLSLPLTLRPTKQQLQLILLRRVFRRERLCRERQDAHLISAITALPDAHHASPRRSRYALIALSGYRRSLPTLTERSSPRAASRRAHRNESRRTVRPVRQQDNELLGELPEERDNLPWHLGIAASRTQPKPDPLLLPNTSQVLVDVQNLLISQSCAFDEERDDRVTDNLLELLKLRTDLLLDQFNRLLRARCLSDHVRVR